MKGSKKLAITILFFIGIATDYSQPVSRQVRFGSSFFTCASPARLPAHL